MGLKNASAVLIVDGKFALQLRDEHAPTSPDTWGLFGGGIEVGESCRAALVREVQEELGIDVSHADHLADIGVVSIFVADVTRQWDSRELREGKADGVFSYEEAQRLKINKITRAALNEARAFL